MNHTISRSTLYRIILFTTLVILSGRIVVSGIAEYYLQDAYDGNAQAIGAVNSWQPDNPKGVYLKAKSLEHSEPEESVRYLHRALSGNPADVRPMAMLARIKSLTGDAAQADELMLLASKSMPANKSLHLRAANYWIGRDDLERALHEWSIALTIAPALGKQLFPLFVRLLENTDTRYLLQPFAIDKPTWWENYFVYATTNASDEEIVSILF